MKSLTSLHHEAIGELKLPHHDYSRRLATGDLAARINTRDRPMSEPARRKRNVLRRTRASGGLDRRSVLQWEGDP
jgi:hypothetical protein